MKRRTADPQSFDRIPFVDRGFTDRVAALSAASPAGDLDAPLRAGSFMTGRVALDLFQSALESRHADFCARRLKQAGEGFYTISSAGHEPNAVVAAALQTTDPAILHYRSGGFFMQRARQAGYPDALRDVLLGVAASSTEPMSGGRHKVFGSAPLSVWPQTSTIASHLPKAVGMAFSLERARRLQLAVSTPYDAVVVCSFGDASANHSTASGAVNAACWAAHQGAAVPLLFVCEDNGFGISVRTPRDWVAASYGTRPSLRYIEADSRDWIGAYDAACEAVDHVRSTRRPCFLHLRVVRLLGHGGSDIEVLYRSSDDIEETEAIDPLCELAALLAAEGLATPDAILDMYAAMRRRCDDLMVEVARQPKIQDATEVVAPLSPRDPEAIATLVSQPLDEAARAAFWQGKLPEDAKAGPLGLQLNRALGDLLVQHPELLLFGEDVAHKGGVYGITRDLARRAKRGRVFDTLLDEQTIFGIAIGAGQLGCVPVPEIQYLAYLHNAEDQLRGEAASMQFFSQGQFRNPMVVRIAAYAYQKGFGGHFHNDNSIGVLRDIPGIVIASPSRGDDAVAMLQTCVAAAKQCGSVCVFLEPIALYPERDLHEKGDGGWCCSYDPRPAHVPIGRARAYGEGEDILIVSWANGLWRSLRVAARLEAEHQIRATVLDLRWLSPLPIADLLHYAARTSRVLVVDETRKSGGVSEGLIAALIDERYDGDIRRVAAHDSFIPLGTAADHVLIQEADIERAVIDWEGAKNDA